MPFAVILPAAGKSSRFGGREKKPYVTLDGRPVWMRAAELFVNRPDVAQLLLVISPEDRELVEHRYAANLIFLDIKLVDGGAERFESVANALAHLKAEADFVAVHDAVRPCSPPAMIDAVFAAARQYGAALPGVAVADTPPRRFRRAGPGDAGPTDCGSDSQVFRRDWLKRHIGGASVGGDHGRRPTRRGGRPPGPVVGLAVQPEDHDRRRSETGGQYLAREAEDKPKPRGPFEDEGLPGGGVA